MFFLMPVAVFAVPIQVTSDIVEIQSVDEFTSLHFLQNANIKGDDFSLNGDRINISINNENVNSSRTSDLSSIREIHAIGNAAFGQKSHRGRADEVSIYPEEKVLILRGNAEVFDVENGTVRGEVLIFDSANGRVRTERNESGRSSISIENFTEKKIEEK